jgi:predicted glycogen debranching enzyme
MSQTLQTDILGQYEEAIQYEWLDANGIGGWASSTVLGANTRRHHGLLVAASSDKGRTVLLSKLDETLVFDGQRFELGCNQFPGKVHPKGHLYLFSFSQDLFPVFEYQIQNIRLRKTISAVHGEDTTLVIYEILEAPRPFTLVWRPFVAARDVHSLIQQNDSLNPEAQWKNGILKIRPYEAVSPCWIVVPQATFEAIPDWYFQFEYQAEKNRGLDFHEDLFTYGTFRRTVSAGDRIDIIISTRHPEGRDISGLMEREQQRRASHLTHIPPTQPELRSLALAADQFIVNSGANRKTIIAGYPWFKDWGRDTIIALPGLCLATGRFHDARQILTALAEQTDQGMLPSQSPDDEQPVYNSVDAALWFFVATYRYLKYTDDLDFVKNSLFPVLKDIIAWYEIGTRYGIRVDHDGLLRSGEPGIPLTWMDARIDGRAVTPRQGKAVEVNALWYNALAITAELAARCGDTYDARHYNRQADQVKARFRRLFWNADKGCLFDVIQDDGKDGSIRPNQVFAISLPIPLLKLSQAEQVLNVVEAHLYTPMGLRSLSPEDPAYCPRYVGPPHARDQAYHQGTVWSWLLGPYMNALIRVRRKTGIIQAARVLDMVWPHLDEAGLGTISEIFDGEPPHTPRGCIARAWSVAEILRAGIEIQTGVLGKVSP